MRNVGEQTFAAELRVLVSAPDCAKVRQSAPKCAPWDTATTADQLNVRDTQATPTTSGFSPGLHSLRIPQSALRRITMGFLSAHYVI
jgi:hypothetical protein